VSVFTFMFQRSETRQHFARFWWPCSHSWLWDV